MNCLVAVRAINDHEGTFFIPFAHCLLRFSMMIVFFSLPTPSPLLFISASNWLKQRVEEKYKKKQRKKRDRSKDYEYIQIYRFLFHSLIKNYNYFSSLLLPDDHEMYFLF